MRLIDANALMENYDIKSATKYGNQTAEQLHNSYSTMMLYEIADMIEDAPTIDAEAVRHGRWIPTELSRTIGMFIGVECSLCSFEKIGHGYKYCPGCGAKMDEEVQG